MKVYENVNGTEEVCVGGEHCDLTYLQKSSWQK